MSVELLPDIREKEIDSGTGSGGFIVIVFDNDFNTFPEVENILRVATGCTRQEAQMETWEVHNLGKSVVHQGTEQECARAAGIIRTIGIRVEVVED